MTDMSAIIVPKSDQINADDLSDGRTMTITVAKVAIRGGQEQPISIHFAGSDKVYRPCKSMCRVLAQGWGLDSSQYVGRSMTLYTDPTVKFGPLAVGGLRISHMSGLDGPMTMALTATKGVKKAYRVLPLVAKPDKVADGVAALIARIQAGEDVAHEPAVQKQREWLAANRPELAVQVEVALGQADQPGRADEDAGEAHTTSDQLADALDHLARKVTVVDVSSLRSAWMEKLDPQDQDTWSNACAERIAAIKGAA